MSPTIYLVKGISGSGKSTRVYLFLEYLESLGLELTPFKFKTLDGKEKEVGVYCEDLDLIFVGKWYENGGVRRWQGHDSMTGRLCHSEGLSYFLKSVAQKGHSVVLDGAGTTATWRLRPKFLFEDNGFKSIVHIRYDYKPEQLQEYYDRIEYRSGEPPKGDSMWRKSKTFLHDYQKAVEEAKMVILAGCHVSLHDEPYDAPVYDLGVRILEHVGLEDVKDEFVAYCQNSDYLIKNSFKSFEDGKGKK